MSAADRNKVIIFGAVALVAIVGIVFFMRGRKSAGASGNGAGGFGQQAAQAPAAGTRVAQAPGAAAPAGTGGATTATGGGVAPVPCVVGGPAAPAAPAGGGQIVKAGPVIQMGTGPTEVTRRDATISFEPPVITTPEERNPLPSVTPGPIRPPGATVVAQIGDRRVAGLLFNHRALAILEKEGRNFIVKPGDVVDGIRITAIAQDAIYVMDEYGKKWQVPLRSATPGTAGTAGGEVVAGMPSGPVGGP